MTSDPNTAASPQTDSSTDRSDRAREALQQLNPRFLRQAAEKLVALGFSNDEGVTRLGEWREEHGLTADPAMAFYFMQNARDLAGPPPPPPEVLTDAEHYRRAKSTAPRKVLYQTGFRTLDSKLNGGIKTSELTIIVGGTGSGKTAFVVNVAVHVAQGGMPVVVFSSELTRQTLPEREAAIVSGGQDDIRTLEFSPSPDRVFELLDGLPIYTYSFADADEDGDPAEIIEAATKEIESHIGKRPLVIVDYVQDLARESEERVRMRVGGLSKQLRRMAAKNGWAIVAVSSTSRANHLKSDGKPISLEYQDYVTHAKESGDVEYDAATLMVLITLPENDPAKPKDAFLMIAKHRGGSYGPVGFTFRGNTGIFTDDPKALERIQAKSTAAQRRADVDKRDAIIAAVRKGATSRAAIFKIVRGKRQIVFARINDLLKSGDLKDSGAFGGGISVADGNKKESASSETEDAA